MADVMKFLIDNSPAMLGRKQMAICGEPQHPLVAGQLLTPLTGYRNAGCIYGVDNGCFKRFDSSKFFRILHRDRHLASNCKFVCCPDKVGDCWETMRLFVKYRKLLRGWPIAFVVQDGQPVELIPWQGIDAIFIGGTDALKNSKLAVSVLELANAMGKHTHVGRVNTPERWLRFRKLAKTCDGSGVSRYDHMLQDILKFALKWELL